MPIKDALIVAAGMGTRLQLHGPSKPLVKVRGKALIEHAMQAAAKAGVQRFVVVTGYLAEQLGEFLQLLARDNNWQLEIIYNPDYQQANGLSVLAAEPALPGPFYLAMCDHLVSPDIYHRLAAAQPAEHQVALAIDRDLHNPYVDIEDVTRVYLKAGKIQQIGKQLINYNAFDTGVFLAGAQLFTALRASGVKAGDYSISGAIRQLAQSGNAIGVDNGNAFWIDIDSPLMYTLAESYLDLKRAYANFETTRCRQATMRTTL